METGPVRRKTGFAWALFCSVMIHIIAFLTVPMSGSVGEFRDETVRRVTETAVDFVTYVKPPPPPPPAPTPQVTQRRVVQRVVRRRPVRRAPRPRPRPAAEESPVTEAEPEPEQAAPEPMPEPAPVAEPEPAPALAVLPPEPQPAPQPVAISASAPEPQPVVIYPTPAAHEEEAPASEPLVASASSLDLPKAVPSTTASAPVAASSEPAPLPGPAAPAPVVSASLGGGRAEGRASPGPVIAMAPSEQTATAEAPRAAQGADVASGEKLSPQMADARAALPGAGSGAPAQQQAGTRPGDGSPRFASGYSPGAGPVGPASSAPARSSGTSGAADRPLRAGEPGPRAPSGAGSDGPKAAPITLAGTPVAAGSGGAGAGGGGASSAAGPSGGGGPVRIALNRGGDGPARVGSSFGGATSGGGGAEGTPGGGSRGTEAPRGGSGDRGDGRWQGAKSAPEGWQVIATAPGVGGEGAGGGQGGAGGLGSGSGGGVGAATGPGVGPVGQLAEGFGTSSQVPAPLQGVVPESLWGALVGAVGLGPTPGGGSAGSGGPGDGKLIPVIVHQPTGGGGAVGSPGGGIAAGAGVDTVPGAGGPVAGGLPAGGGGEGGPGLPPLPALGERLALAGSADGLPGLGGLGPGWDLSGAKSTPGGLYTNVSGSFDMPMGITTSDYHTDAEGMRNLLGEMRQRTNIRVTVHDRYVPLTLENVQHSPVLHLRGHRAFSLTEEERETLRRYVASGGTIFGEDSHGPFGECFRREMHKTFGTGFGNLGVDHEIYRTHYVLDRVPAGDMGERYPLQGIEVEGGRLGVIFSRNDYGDCWEGTGEWVRPESREPAFRMGVNIFTYIVAQWQRARDQQADR